MNDSQTNLHISLAIILLLVLFWERGGRTATTKAGISRPNLFLAGPNYALLSFQILIARNAQSNSLKKL